MRKTEQSSVAVRVLHPPKVQQDVQTFPHGNTLPPRSRLYGMSPCGEGLLSESLTSYLNRLGWRHGVSPRWLVAQEMGPYLNSDYLPPQLAAFCWQKAMSINGNGSLALAWSAVLEGLTGRSDLHWLTLHGWIGDLPDHGHLRAKPAWCPLCYREWREQGTPIYQPQIWMFQVVTLCPRHHRQLEVQCPYCHKPQPIIVTDKSKVGQCTQCATWLDTEMGPPPDGPSGEELRWQEWVFQALEELHLTSVSSTLPQWERFFTNLATCLKEPKGYSQLARWTGITRSVFYRWPGRTDAPRSRARLHSFIPSLETILECCYVCDVTPLQMMMNQLAPLKDLIRAGTAAQPVRPRPSQIRINRQKCLELIQAILNGSEEPLSIRQLAKRLGYGSRALTDHFPQECALIAKRAHEYRKQRREQRELQVPSQVRQAVLTLHVQGLFPSHRRLRALLPPGVMRQPEANTAWHAALRELGLKQ